MTPDLDQASFCFDCARAARDEKLAPPMPNPWPMLVPPAQLGHLRCQPLVRLVYSPRPLAHMLSLLSDDHPSFADTPAGRAALGDRFRVMHEYVHFFVLDRTPAKELARAHLAYAYDLIGLFTRLPDRSEQRIRALWDSFVRVNHRLSQTLMQIGFVEELLATAFAAAMVDDDTQPGRPHEAFRDVYAVVKAEALASHAASHADFLAVYEHITPLIRLMNHRASFFNLVMPLLQPVQWQDDDLCAVDAKAYVTKLVTALGAVDSITAAEQLLHQQREIYDSGWRLALELQQTNAAEPEIIQDDLRIRYGTIAGVLLDAARGDVIYGRSRVAALAPDFSFDAGPSGILCLALGRYRRRSVLERMTWFLREADDTSEARGRYAALAHFEALRQQLCARRGIVCPENPRGTRRCHCSPEIRTAVHTLADLASNQYFGPGEWERPVCRP